MKSVVRRVSGILGRDDRVFRLIALAVLIPPLLQVPQVWADSVTPDAITGQPQRHAIVVDRLDALWRVLPADAILAVRPIDGARSGLPDALTDRLDSIVLERLTAASPSSAQVLSRRDVSAVFDETESFQGRDSADVLADLSASVVALPRAYQDGERIFVEVDVVGLSGASVGRIVARVSATEMPVSAERAIAASPAVATRRAGTALAERVRAQLDAVNGRAAQVKLSGQRSEFGDWVLNQTAPHLTETLGRGALFVTQPLRTLGVQDGPIALALSADVFDLGSMVDVAVRARGAGADVTVTTRILKSAIPGTFLPLSRDGGRVGSGLYKGQGLAVVGPGLSVGEARWAADLMARVNAMSTLTGAPSRGPEVLTNRSQLVDLFSALERAVPHAAAISGQSEASGEVSVSLSAKIRRVGGRAAPRMKASLDRSVYRAGVPLRLKVRMSDAAYLAAFVLQADGHVARMAPFAGREAVEAGAGRPITLPGPYDPDIASAPLPGQTESVEAILVLASSVPFDPSRLAPAPPDRADAPSTGRTLAAFLDRLGSLDLTRARILIRSFRTRADAQAVSQ